MTDPILYSFRRCPYAMRARLALAMSGQRCEIREVKLSAKPAEMLEASPKATVPVLVLPDGHVVDESLDIMHWALGRHDPENWLSGDDKDLIAQNDGAFKYHLDRYKYPQRHDSDALAHRTSAQQILARLDHRLAEYGGQLTGPTRALADMATMPFVRQFASVEPEWFAGLDMPHLQRWLANHVQSSLFDDIMKRWPVWNHGDAPLSFGSE
ncbi:glutathione S-transferase [Sphingopyxis yananensis]|uniref:glutathione S-transferase n=1 Tax=Sphingopyxis yananensis TaxID=2886687 RepID=UPI001D103023|nr:glutathione S-transferase [Sphingopyxis yananensis]MCC2602485.1 glutathione S-transferase [Sphingopyxis yananensis]